MALSCIPLSQLVSFAFSTIPIYHFLILVYIEQGHIEYDSWGSLTLAQIIALSLLNLCVYSLACYKCVSLQSS